MGVRALFCAVATSEFPVRSGAGGIFTAPYTITRDSAHGKTVKNRRRRATVRRIFSARATVVGFDCRRLQFGTRDGKVALMSCIIEGISMALDEPPSQETERNLNLGKNAMR